MLASLLNQVGVFVERIAGLKSQESHVDFLRGDNLPRVPVEITAPPPWDGVPA